MEISIDRPEITRILVDPCSSLAIRSASSINKIPKQIKSNQQNKKKSIGGADCYFTFRPLSITAFDSQSNPSFKPAPVFAQHSCIVHDRSRIFSSPNACVISDERNESAMFPSPNSNSFNNLFHSWLL